MGLLMTPDLWPRVRLAVVTTDLPLTPDPRRPDPSVVDFCTICEKCAQNCPSRSIPTGERSMEEGVLRWRINSDTCFRYWNVAGSDCGVCMSVCPYSHPDNVYHNIIRRGTRRSGAFRRAALWLDNLFYGEKPAPRPAPAWIKKHMK
jgi:epoxyqueuosine reductase QueG